MVLPDAEWRAARWRQGWWSGTMSTRFYRSYLRSMCMLYEWLPTMREDLFQPLMHCFSEMLLEQHALKRVFAIL